jgi:hypothetical protein
LGIIFGKGDTISGDTSRIDVAATCVESLFYQNSINKVFEIVNQGDRPTIIDWQNLFSQL